MVSIVIINYNTRDLTIACIQSVIQFTKETRYEIILVDNASTEVDAEIFVEQFPQIKLIKSSTNIGFAKGNNLGISNANGDIILLLNSDTYLEEDSISKAAIFLKSHNDIGVLGVTLHYPDRRIQHYTRRFRSISNELLDCIRPVLYLLPYRKRAEIMLNQYYQGDFDVEADWIGGAFFMFPSKLLQLLPEQHLDERYFMYGEDQLWCYQIKQLGYKCFNYSGTHIVHIEGGSNRDRQPRFNKKYLERDIDIYRLRNANKLNIIILKTIFFGKKYIAYLIKSLYYKLSN